MEFTLRLLLILSLVFIQIGTAHARDIINSERLADAIYKAEGGDIAKPYGILKDYCKRGDPDGQCRKGCIQTIEKHKKRIKADSFEDWLKQFAEIYAPTKNVTNDKNHLNKNWFKNVKFYYLTPNK